MVLETSRKILRKGRLFMVSSVPNRSVFTSLMPFDVGVNTGFGGSADTRNSNVDELQQTLVRELHYGILATNPCASSHARECSAVQANDISIRSRTKSIFERALPLDDPVASTCMPESWARAAILIRINSLISGHSGVRRVVVERMTDLLKHGIIPRIPVRGSISASGDLSPLSYVGGVLQGKSTLTVWADHPDTGERRVTNASQAFAEKSLEPIQLKAKEGLAVVNGTAISCAVGALAVQEAHNLAVLAQILTAMSVEALQGSVESFNPFFAAVRPHSGQIESARNIDGFLIGSQLTAVNDGSEEGVLRQDRYSIRTASQWLGPCLEDLTLAHQQTTIECNSVTDNPLIDDKGDLLHGGNFQAKAITSAMEKTRLCLQSIGQMLYTQCTELINPATNRGLPSNLVADEPGKSFIFKGVDLLAAALQSELGFLSNPAGIYVQPAEMGNQALNSLALISARYTHTAADVLSQLAAGHLMALCQALDLRAMHARFLDDFKQPFYVTLQNSFGEMMKQKDLGDLQQQLWKEFDRFLGQNMMMDSKKRIRAATNAMQATILAKVPADTLRVSRLKEWFEHCTNAAQTSYAKCRETYIAHPDATPLLGRAAKRMYDFVRHELKIPFLLTSMLLDMETDSATLQNLTTGGDGTNHQAEEAKLHGNRDTQRSSRSNKRKLEDVEDRDNRKRIHTRSGDDLIGGGDTVGSFIGRIHGAIRNGSLFAPVMACLQESTDLP